ncbi:hypothetical protein IL306_008848 [Fusarium sp. DS 682]|nr:hypothetical protein IL306_008848 [Fusarium sp. DS 682]
MPTAIPYDPSLTLMSVVTDSALKTVEAIAQAQAPVDAAQDALNSHISSKRSLTMTKTELKNLGVGTEALDAELEKLNAAVDKAAADYAKAKVTAEFQINNLRKEVRSVHQSIESPVDRMRCEVKTMPLAADAMNMDVRYFTYDSNTQNSIAFSAQVGSYVSGAASTVFGSMQPEKISTAASHQVTRQLASSSIEGTLIISVACTHKNASIMAPFVLHVDKAIKVWNQLFPGKNLDPTSRQSMMKVAMNESQDRDKFSIISGTTFGSCFVGMVHILKSSDPSVSASLEAAASSLQSSMDTGSWFARSGGRTGMNASMAKNIKNILSQQNIKSQVEVFTAGVPLSFQADEVIKAVNKLASFDPKLDMETVFASQNTNSLETFSAKVMAEASHVGSQAPGPNNIQASLDALADIDGKTKTLDINSLMSALDEYLKKASEGNSGIPVNYYLKDIDQKMLAQLWVAEYFPGQFMAIEYGDTENRESAKEDPRAKV